MGCLLHTLTNSEGPIPGRRVERFRALIRTQLDGRCQIISVVGFGSLHQELLLLACPRSRCAHRVRERGVRPLNPIEQNATSLIAAARI
jgi:hypothetical protein